MASAPGTARSFGDPHAVIGSAGAWYGVRIRSRIDAPTYRRWLRGALYAIAAMLIGQYAYETLI